MWKFNPIALERRERVTADNLIILGSSRKWPGGRQKSWFIATNADLQEKKGAANIFSWHLGEKTTSLDEKANDEWGRCIYLGINILQRRAEMCRELQEKLFNKSVLTFLSLYVFVFKARRLNNSRLLRWRLCYKLFVFPLANPKPKRHVTLAKNTEENYIQSRKKGKVSSWSNLAQNWEDRPNNTALGEVFAPPASFEWFPFKNWFSKCIKSVRFRILAAGLMWNKDKLCDEADKWISSASFATNMIGMKSNRASFIVFICR